MRHQIQIPFEGFYNSFLDDLIDDAFERLKEEYEHVPQDFYQHIPYREIHQKIAAEWVSELAYTWGVDMTFTSLVSPLEYNFETDRVFGEIAEHDLIKIINELGKTRIFHEYKGFMPFSKYWPLRDTNILNWDAVQLGIVLEAYFKENPVDVEVMREFITNTVSKYVD